MIFGSTDLITAPEVTGKPEGVKTGGGALLLLLLVIILAFCIGLGPLGLGPILGPNGGLKAGALTSEDGVVGGGGALLTRCC